MSQCVYVEGGNCTSAGSGGTGGRRRRGRVGQRTQIGTMTRDTEDSDGGRMDDSTSRILKRGHPSSWSGPVPILGGWAKPQWRRLLFMLISCETNERGERERNPPEEEGEGVAWCEEGLGLGLRMALRKRRRVWSRSFGSRCTHTSRESHVRAILMGA